MEQMTIRQCGAQEAWAALINGRGCQLVDVREFSEYEAERVAEAVLAPLSALEQNAGVIDRSRPVYLLCRSGKRAGQAAERLARLGYSDLRVIDGGLQAWAAAGLPVERGAGRVWALERQVRFLAGLLVLAGVLLSLISPWFILIAGFIGAGLTFSAVTDTCGMGMMLARMPWNRMPEGRSGAACARS
jgi:rhodanese-related sulfurtransferase